MRINAPETFQDVEQTLAAQYDRWVGKTRDATQIRNMVERCYHYATYLKTTEAPDLNHLLHQELERYVDTYFCSGDADATQAFYSQLNRLYNTLEEDKDLQSLVDVPQLLNAIRERLQHPEASRQQEEPA